ncbi:MULTISPECIES: hypothetical protein [unclassified Streptomyces]|uniref:hypothetical protein n=1 Tax=unclassified Streptomyces TaxID=2593676 RepID=UPI002441B02D|nr:hypothetical protein [Streptomyces sp. DH41]MDG9723075.1 hypothetical protein [Streptomyces sp. DH41]
MPLTVVHAQTAGQPRVTGRRGPRPCAPLSLVEADVLRIVADTRTPVFVTVRAGGRRRYSYWRPLDSATGRGGCYAALPTAECDKLHAAGRIALGDPLTDPARTTYRVTAVRTPAGPARAVRARPHAA